MDVEVLHCRWDAIIGVLRAAAPSLGIYGGDKGGDLPKMIQMLNDQELLARVARALREIERDYRIATAEASQVMDAAGKRRNEKYAALIASLKT